MQTEIATSSPEDARSERKPLSIVLVAAWVATLTVSLLPTIVFQETTGRSPAWLLPAQFSLIALLVLSTFAWKAIRPLRAYFAIFAVYLLASWGNSRLIAVPQWRSWFSGTAFSVEMLETQILKLLVAVVLIAALFVIRKRRSEFFLVKGQLNASAAPVRWLGIDKPISWARLAPLAALCICSGTLLFLLSGGPPSSEQVVRALPLLPIILVLAAFNAFSEQVSYRTALLATTHDVVGKTHALLLVAFYFGIAHFYGVPYGILGVVMAGFIGWFLAKAMLETRGFFWPWFIHFCQDVLIFSFIAIGSAVPGG
jgi:hypothetical protein